MKNVVVHEMQIENFLEGETQYQAEKKFTNRLR